MLAASLTFLVLMFPRGVSYVMKLFLSEEKVSMSQWKNEIHLVVDMLSWWLQYLNHSINFFVYVLANKNFRFSS